jgi:hypothetical protein
MNVELDEWRKYIQQQNTWAAQSPIGIESIVILPEQYQDISKETFIASIASYGASTDEQYSERLKNITEAVTYADAQFAASERKRKRKTGEDTIFHSLRMAHMLASQGITDMTVLCATILHDTHEDLGIPLSTIKEKFGDDVARLVDIVTKVKTNKLNGKKNVQESGEKPTLLKFFDALGSDDYRAMYIKIADIADNSATYDHYDGVKAKYKAGLALKYYEPLARKLGLHGMAQIIGDNAMKIVNSKEYDEIFALREQINGTFLVKELYQQVASWFEHQNMGLGVELFMESIAIRQPGIYEIYASAPKHKVAREHVLPRVEVVALNWLDAVAWYELVRLQSPDISVLSEDVTRDLRLNAVVKGVANLNVSGIEERITIELVTQKGIITPAQLDISGVHLAHDERAIALKKLDILRKSYREAAKRKENTLEQMAERLRHDVSMSVTAPDGKTYEFNQVGITVLDFAYRMGKGLGNSARGAFVERNGKIVHVLLSEQVQHGDVIHIVTDSKETNSLYQVRPQWLDWVQTEKARKDIRDELNRCLFDKQTPEKVKEDIRNAAYRRGVDSIKWLYESLHGSSLDFSLEYGFDRKLHTIYETKERFLEELGLIALRNPLGKEQQQELLDVWQDVSQLSVFDKKSTITPQTQTLAEGAIELAKNLMKFRKTRPSVRIELHSDAPGVLESISHVVGRFGINMLPLRGAANLYAKGQGALVEMCLIDGDLAQGNVDNLLRALAKTLKGTGIVTFIPPQKN